MSKTKRGKRNNQRNNHLTITQKFKTMKNKEINGMFFDKKTPDEVCYLLSNYCHTGKRLKIYYGDTQTGIDWHEEHDIIGTVGRSTGNIKIPLLIPNIRSVGGPGILSDCIIKIIDMKTKKTIYQHPKYQKSVVTIVPSDMEGYTHNTLINGILHGRHKSLRSAQICKAKIQ